MKVVVYLNWRERCFRASASDLSYLKSLLPKGAKVMAVRNDGAFKREIREAEIAITWHFRREWYKLAPKLRVLATPAAGQELIERQEGALPKVHFGHFHGSMMAESVVAFCLAWSRGFFLQTKSSWPREEISDKVRELAGTTAVVLGYGNVGRAIGEKLRALGVEVKGFSRHRPLTADKLRSILPDWLIMALPSNTRTDNLVDAAFLRKLPRKCVLINVGRGNSLDEAALIKALKANRLAGAYLDVIKNEPSKTAPIFDKARLDFTQEDPIGRLGLVGRLIVSPHSSAFSPSYMRKCFKELKDDRCF